MEDKKVLLESYLEERRKILFMDVSSFFFLVNSLKQNITKKWQERQKFVICIDKNSDFL